MSNLRLKKFRDCLKNKGLDGALVYSDTNRNYLSRFKGDESYIIVTQNDAIFITDSRYVEQAKGEVDEFEVREYDKNIVDYIKETVNSLKIKTLGFEEDFVTYKVYSELKEALEGVTLLGIGGTIEKLRQIKEDSEIKYIGKAAEIADKAFIHMLEFIKPGMTEEKIGLELEFFMRLNGAQKLSFNSIVASGKRSCLPHGTATSKIVENGDFLTLDYGCVYNGYCSDMTRTIVIGKASEKQKEIYDIVLEANKAGLKAIKPGITGYEADKAARDVIEKHGYGQYFGHSLGHGVGVDIHELPRLSKKGFETLRPGMVVTDEPGIYIPDFGGVRIEDLVLVTDDGLKVLSKSNKELIEL
jgi:Xaa-Pro aminopeptidase